ncbi:MAG TPA: ATP-binding cassette domain-containing protein [Candidatus Peregrinibacteria bacterium]|nr:ATP-binding cassette domain-containing protein [Candidatus Peregrinibacteria bacterium]
MILFENIAKKFGSQDVLSDINLKIRKGEFIVITGTSGAGKTTLINILIGNEKADRGKVFIDEHEVSKAARNFLQLLRRQIGIVFQDYKLLARKTIFENLAFVLEACEFPEKAILPRIQRLLKKVNLEEKGTCFPGQLSGGEKQRAAIARALAHRPPLLIADEPTGNLDPQNSSEILDILLDINSNGTTVILTTHNQNIVEKLQELKRIVHLREGRIYEDLGRLE